MEYLVRTYIQGDYPHICRIERDLFGDYGYSPIFLRQAGELFHKTYLIAAHGDDPIGYIIGAQESDDRKEAWILRIGVANEWQGQGVGVDLLVPLLESFRKRGVKRVRIAISKRHTPVTTLLQSKNFEILSYEQSYYHPDIDRMIMELLL